MSPKSGSSGMTMKTLDQATALAVIQDDVHMGMALKSYNIAITLWIKTGYNGRGSDLKQIWFQKNLTLKRLPIQTKRFDLVAARGMK